jgi:hypothetical protein
VFGADVGTRDTAYGLDGAASGGEGPRPDALMTGMADEKQSAQQNCNASKI